MKLKKIASLALAGLMAVSMLAGCGDNSSNNGSEVAVGTGSTSIVEAVNNGQNINNEVKIDFTSNANLEDALKAALAKEGDGATAADVWTNIGKMTAETYDNNNGKNSTNVDNIGIWTDDTVPVENSVDVDGESKTFLMVFTIKANAAQTETAALKIAADAIDAQIKKLPESSKDQANGNNPKYYNYDYDASVVMVPVQQANGTTWYYVAVEFTQSATEATKKP